MTEVAADSAAKVTYIANEGFLIEVAKKKVLVDALFYDETINWCHAPGADTLKQMEGADGPFEGVDLILITHRHVDHFAPAVVLKHLAGNAEGIVVGPPQAISKLRAEQAWAGEYKDRVREVDLELFGSTEMTIRGIHLQVHRIRHGAYPITDEKTGKSRNKHEDVENLAYLVEIGGVKFIHLGDAFLRENQDYFDGRRFAKRQIDLVFLEGWSDETLEVMQKWMSPRKVIFMHMPPEPEKIERLSAYLTSKLPNAVVFRERMESRSF
jgi:L-ascorbate metabolism protein UlaG (beta-lactamase superfamily)